MNRRDPTKNVVCLIDMDCFYCQVEEKLDPGLKGRPVAVVQYNAWQGGGIIAVNYAARACGVTRHMRGDEAKKHCPQIQLVRVPNVREKADLSKYRDAGKEVAVVLQKNTNLLERASVDEAYLDITERVEDRMRLVNSGQYVLSPETLTNTFAVGHDVLMNFVNHITGSAEGANHSQEHEQDVAIEYDDDSMDEASKMDNLKLLIGATIVNEIRAQVKAETGYECSAGIAHNKILAKLTCGINKPNKQTVLPFCEVPKLFEKLAINKLTGLGGKFGEIVCETLKVKYMGDLLRFGERELQTKFEEKNGSWLYLLCRGIDLEPVTPKYNSKSIGCCKKFPGKNAIKGINNLLHWLNELATEINDRLEKDLEENNRRAHLLTVSYMQSVSGEDISSSRSVALDSYEVEKIARAALECIKKNTEKFTCATVTGNVNNPIKFLGLSVGKFEKLPSGRNRIQEMFKKQEVKVKEKPAEEKVTPVVQEKEMPKEGFFSRYLKKMEEEKRTKATEDGKTAIDCGPAPETKEEEVATIVSLPATKEIPHAPPAYRTEYAEFHGQAIINLEEFKKVCPKCGIKVLNCDYDSHLDYHVALNLSAQLKMEHRAMHQQSILVNDGANKQKIKPSATITSGQFLKLTEEQNVTTTKPLPQADAEQGDPKETVPNQEQGVLIINAEEASEEYPENTNSSGNDNELGDLILEMEKDSSVEGLKEGNVSLVKQETSTVSVGVPPLKVKDEFKEPPSYESEYAEFSLQNINLDDFMKVCPQCNVKVRNYEYDSHLDFHMAMELSQQQRVEHRASLRAVKKEAASQSPKATKGATKSQKVNKTVTSSSQILKYLIKDPEEATQMVEGAEICGECGKAIPLEEVMEHSDLHVAKKLQMELMREERQAVVTKTSSPVVLKKRKGASTQGMAIAKFFRGTT